MDLIHRLVVIDSVFQQPKDQPFDCIQIMNHIRDNEANHRTLPHGEIAIYLHHLHEKGILQIADPSGEYTRYTVAPVNQAAEQNCPAAFLFLQSPNSIP